LRYIEISFDRQGVRRTYADNHRPPSARTPSRAAANRVGRGRLSPLEVVDRYADGTGSVTGRLFGRYETFHQADQDVDRSGAARAAMEAVFAPASLPPGGGVSWRTEDEDHIVASSYLEPEHVDVHMQIDPRGLRAVSAKRWGNSGKHSHS
jgi:hypothetical protein